jgi:hypothetical protein
MIFVTEMYHPNGKNSGTTTALFFLIAVVGGRRAKKFNFGKF